MPSVVKFFNPKYGDGAAVDALMQKEEKARKEQRRSLESLISAVFTSQQTGYPSEFTWRELVASYTSWVFTSVDKISKTIAGAPKRLYAYKSKSTGKYVQCREIKNLMRSLTGNDRRLYRKSVGKNYEREEILEHPLLDLLYAPNHVDTPGVFWQEIVQRLELAGSCGIVKRSGMLGVPMSLWVLPTSENGEFKPIPDPKLVISGFMYQDGEIQERFSTEQAFWLRYPNPKNKFEGMSALKAQIYPYNIDYYLSKQQYKFFKNNAIMGHTFSTDKVMVQDQLDYLYDKIEEKFGGAGNAYKTLILHSGLKAEDPKNVTARDMMLDVIGKFAKDRMLSSYGINEGMVGLTENQNKANLDTSRENYIEECIRPRVNLIMEAFEKWLIPDFDDRLEFQVDLPEVQQRELDVSERGSNLDRQVTTINEERDKMGMDPVDWGERPYIDFTKSQIPKGGIERREPAQPTEPVGEEGDEDDDTDRNTPAKAQTKAANDILWKKFDLNTRKAMELFRKTAVKMFEEQREETLDNLQARGAVLKGNIAGWSRKRTQEWLAEHKEKLQGLSFDRKEWEKRTVELFTPVFKSVLKEAGESRMEELNPPKKASGDYTFNLDEPSVAKWLGTKLRKFSKDVTGTTFDEIEAVLRTGFEEGQGLSDIASTLREKFDAAEEYRAMNIARTEAANTWNQGELESVEQLGLEDQVQKYWINEPGARETHAKAGIDYSEDKAIDLDEDFEVGDDVMQVPGGGSLAEENCNCRCTLGYKKKEA